MQRLVQALREQGLRTKIIARSFVPTAIILLGVALVAFFAFQNVTEELVLERDLAVVVGAASQLTTQLEKYEDLLASVARTLQQGDPGAQRQALQQVSNRLVVFDGGALLLDIYGNVVAAEPERAQILGQDWSERNYYRDIVRFQRAGISPDLFLSNVASDGPNGADVVVCALPIIGARDEFRGVLAGMFRVDPTAINTLYGDVVRLRIGMSGSMYLVDGEGRIIYHSDAEHIGKDLNAPVVEGQILNGQAGAVRIRNLAGQDTVAAFAPVSGTPWGLVTEESWPTLARGFQRYQNFLIFLLVMGGVVPAILVHFGVRQITRPIKELIPAAQEVARGNFGQTITAQTGDEIEELARQFNLMSAQLEESYAHLEQRVADRTRELATLNAIARVVSRSLDLSEILGNALDEILGMLRIESGAILLMGPDGETVTPRVYRNLPEELFVKAANHTLQDEDISVQATARVEPIVLEALDQARYLLPLVRQEGEHTLASAPIVHKDRALGALILITRRSRAFPIRELALLTALGQQIGVGVENARLYASIQQELAERVRAEEKLQKYTVELQEANAELSQYAYVVSHDVRAPLRAIRNYVRFLREDLATTLDDELKQYLDGLGRAAQEADELVEDLLELSKVGQRDAPVETIPVGVFLRELVAALDLATEAEITLTDDWPTVDVEPVLLRQVFQNLISNAIKFNESPVKRVELGWRLLGDDSPEGGYEFFVRDNGIGIAPRYLEQIFRVFERLHTRQEYEGTGIGLAIVKKAVSRLGGSVRVESSPGAGSTFFVTLPQAQKGGTE
jgi:signal transduction histidine kinase